MRGWSERNELNVSEFSLRLEIETFKHKAEATRTGPSVVPYISRGRYCDPNPYDCLFQPIIYICVFQPRFCMCHSSGMYTTASHCAVFFSHLQRLPP